MSDLKKIDMPDKSPGDEYLRISQPLFKVCANTEPFIVETTYSKTFHLTNFEIIGVIKQQPNDILHLKFETYQ